jgi:hypothetical protein
MQISFFYVPRSGRARYIKSFWKVASPKNGVQVSFSSRATEISIIKQRQFMPCFCDKKILTSKHDTIREILCSFLHECRYEQSITTQSTLNKGEKSKNPTPRNTCLNKALKI